MLASAGKLAALNSRAHATYSGSCPTRPAIKRVPTAPSNVFPFFIAGWYWVKTVDDHWQFKHPIIKAKVTVVPRKKAFTMHFILKDIEKKSGLKF